MQATKEILLVNGGRTLVDEQDYERHAKYRWFRNHSGYAFRQGWSRKSNGTRMHWQVFLHREINQTPAHLFTDHINGNKLDNRRCNLRTCTKAENAANSKPLRGRKFKGVSFHASSGLWRCRLRCNGKEYTTYHRSELDAAAHYGTVSGKLFGAFGRSNDIGDYKPIPHVPQKRHSRFRGVTFRNNRWLAKISAGGKERQIGSFNTEIEAAVAYNREAIRAYGGDAKLNSI